MFALCRMPVSLKSPGCRGLSGIVEPRVLVCPFVPLPSFPWGFVNSSEGLVPPLVTDFRVPQEVREVCHDMAPALLVELVARLVEKRQEFDQVPGATRKPSSFRDPQSSFRDPQRSFRVPGMSFRELSVEVVFDDFCCSNVVKGQWPRPVDM